jgi:hypothetical protein
MAASVNLVQFYHQDASALAVNVWMMEGAMPFPKWPDADTVFGVNMVGDAI